MACAIGAYVVWGAGLCCAVSLFEVWVAILVVKHCQSFRGPVATPRLFQGFACSCCGLQGVVLRGGFILWFVVLMLVIQGGGFILWFEGVLDKVRVGVYFLDEG